MLELVKIRFDDYNYSWTVIDDHGNPVDEIRDWIVHLEQINLSPNTIQAYARHVARLGTYLHSNSKEITGITVSDYDRFLEWLPYHLSGMADDSSNLAFLSPSLEPAARLGPTVNNQVHLAVKSFYRYLTGREPAFASVAVSNRHQPVDSYKPFLEHINQRRSVRMNRPGISGGSFV